MPLEIRQNRAGRGSEVKRILAVDDESFNIIVMTEIMKRINSSIELKTAYNGEQAL